MKSIDVQMKEILRRKKYYQIRKRTRRYTVLMALFAGLLITMMAMAPGVGGSTVQFEASVLGATILGPEAGGYVIVALLSFALGIVSVLAIQNYRRMKEMKIGFNKDRPVDNADNNSEQKGR